MYSLQQTSCSHLAPLSRNGVRTCVISSLRRHENNCRRRQRLACSHEQDECNTGQPHTKAQQGLISDRSTPGILMSPSFVVALVSIGAGLWLGTESAATAGVPGPQYHPIAADIQNLAQNEDFWTNLGRYGTYFFSVLLGTAYTALKPVAGLLKRPVTAVFTVAAIAGLVVFVSTTVKAMLGVSGGEMASDLDYLLQ